MNHTSTRKLDTFECYNYGVLGDIQIDLARCGGFPGEVFKEPLCGVLDSVAELPRSW